MRLRTVAWVLVGLLAVGLRLYHLGAESVWLDEATSIDTAHDPLFAIPGDAAQDVHPPLYYLMLHGWVAVAGDSEVAVRSLSVVFGLGTIAALGIFARRWFDDRTALLVALLAAVSPFEIGFAQEARMYALLMLTAVLSTDSFLRFTCTGSRLAGAAYVISTAAMLYTHAYAAFVIGGQLLWLSGTLAGSREWRLRAWRAFIGLGLAVVLFLPWLPAQLAQVHGVEREFWIPATATVGAALASQAGSTVAAWLIVPLAILGFAMRSRREPATAACAAVVVAVIGGPWIVSRFSSPIFLAKYTIACSPAFLLLAARGMASLPIRVLRAAVVVAAVALTTAPLRAYFSVPHKDNWRRIANAVEAQAQPGDLVIYSQAFGASPFRYYAHRSDLAEVPFLDEHRGLTTHALDVLADAVVKRYARVWLVMSDPDEATDALRRRLDRESSVTSIAGGGVEARLFVLAAHQVHVER